MYCTSYRDIPTCNLDRTVSDEWELHTTYLHILTDADLYSSVGHLDTESKTELPKVYNT